LPQSIGWELDFYDFQQTFPDDVAIGVDIHDRARANGARHGTPLLTPPSGRADARLNRFFRYGAMAALRPQTWRRYAYSILIWLDFLEVRPRAWDEAAPNDVETFKDWRLTDQRNPERVTPAAFSVDRAALNALYAWAWHEYGIANPVPTVRRIPALDAGTWSDPAGPELRRRDGLRPAGAARRQVKWMLRPAYEQWRDIGLRGYGFGGQRRPGWHGFNEDRDVAFADGLYGTGLRLGEWASILDVELPAEGVVGRYPMAWLSAACLKGGREGRPYRVPRAVMPAIRSYLDPLEGSRTEVIERARRRGAYDQVADLRIVTGYNPASRCLFVAGPDGSRPVSVNSLGPAERRRLFRRTPQGLEPLAVWLSIDGLPKIAHSWEDTFQAANARVRTSWLAAGGAAEAQLFCRPHMLRHSFALKWFSILSVVWDHRLEGFSAAEKRDLRDQFGDIWYQLATLLDHADPATTRTYYLEPFTGLDVDYLMSVLDDGERAAVDALARAAGMAGGKTLAAITPPGAQAIACYLDEDGDTR
jgi:integrase